MLKLIPCYTEEESAEILDRIYSVRNLWEDQAYGFAPAYTLGTATYIHAANLGEKGYRKLAQERNPILKKHFSDVYDHVAQVLEKELGMPVVYDELLGLPGFHIFLYHRMFEQPVASVHFDLQFQQHHWDHYKEVDFEKPISFTLPFILPSTGGGLNWWDVYLNENPNREQMNQYMREKEMHFLEYHVGDLVLHHGTMMHQIAPMPGAKKEDARISLQGHGVVCDGKMRLYW